MKTAAGSACAARVPATAAATDSATIPNHSTGKTRFRKNVLREEIRLAVSAAGTLLLALLLRRQFAAEAVISPAVISPTAIG
jgi:hypothetical protein